MVLKRKAPNSGARAAGPPSQHARTGPHPTTISPAGPSAVDAANAAAIARAAGVGVPVSAASLARAAGAAAAEAAVVSAGSVRLDTSGAPAGVTSSPVADAYHGASTYDSATVHLLLRCTKEVGYGAAGVSGERKTLKEIFRAAVERAQSVHGVRRTAKGWQKKFTRLKTEYAEYLAKEKAGEADQFVQPEFFSVMREMEKERNKARYDPSVVILTPAPNGGRRSSGGGGIAAGGMDGASVAAEVVAAGFDGAFTPPAPGIAAEIAVAAAVPPPLAASQAERDADAGEDEQLQETETPTAATTTPPGATRKRAQRMSQLAFLEEYAAKQEERSNALLGELRRSNEIRERACNAIERLIGIL